MIEVLKMVIADPTNGAIIDGLGSTITFEGSVTTSDTSLLYFGWFSTVMSWSTTTSPFSTVMDEARINANSQGASALSFSTHSPRGGSWGMGTQWIQFMCKNTSSETDFSNVTLNGFDGGREEITISPTWTIYPRVIHILNSAIIHPYKTDRFDAEEDPTYWSCHTSGSVETSGLTYAPFYFEMRNIMPWTVKDERTETDVDDWNTDTNDELVAELHQGSIGTAGDAIIKTDVDSTTFVIDLTNSGYQEYETPCLWGNWATTGIGTYTFNLLLYHKDNRVTSGTGSVVSSVTIEVVA